ncbi:MAG: hypothetical protein WAX03_10765, partial [Trichococcus flocculiformis]
LEAAQKLNDPDNGVYGILAPLNRQEGYHNFIFQNGGYVLSDDKTESGFRLDETIEAVQWYADLSVKHGVSPTQSQFAEKYKLVLLPIRTRRNGLLRLLDDRGDGQQRIHGCEC